MANQLMLTSSSPMNGLVNGVKLENKTSFKFYVGLKLSIEVMTEVTVTILFFAQARELAKLNKTTVRVPKILFGHDLRSILIDQFNLLSIGNIFVLAINESYTSDDLQIILEENDIVAVIPPISGDLKILSSELNVSSAINFVNSPQCGAISIFIGTTREEFDGNKVKTLFYEAYESMALNEMKNVTLLARQKWPEVVNIVIHHRIGEVKVGEASIVVAASSPHRKHAQEAVSFMLDQLKTTVPIFKKELYEDGSGTWKANNECSWKNNTIKNY